MIRVMVVDDEVCARERMVKLVTSDPELEVVAQAADGREALRLLEEHHVDVLLLDISPPIHGRTRK